jgi:7-cyano-7-deazaguanine synthase in queuosine biosynthesis
VTALELRPSASRAKTRSQQLVWPKDRTVPGDLRSDLNPWLTEFGHVSDPLIDLVRLATAAFLADQRVRRPSHTFTRTIDLTVQLTDPSCWTDDVLNDLADLLAWLTGDAWSIEVDAERRTRRPARARRVPRADAVSLLSGGLDSFAGATMTAAYPRRLYFGQRDGATSVKHAQDEVAHWFEAQGQPIRYRRVRHGISGRNKVERSTRSRALLFMALGSALAEASGATRVEVPENGFTSLNPPLGPERGGPLSTRSTHPETFERVNQLMASLGIGIVVSNPHEWLTKGELIRAGAAAMPAGFEDGAALTLSCAKLDSGRYKGGDPTVNCGLCVACLVRRASFVAAGIADRSRYAKNLLIGEPLAKLLRNRHDDCAAVAAAVASGIDDVALLSLDLPPTYDIERGVDLCRRGLTELAYVAS